MVTRAQIVIKREDSGDIYLYQNHDGYIEGPHGVGYQLCKKIQELLQKYSNTRLQKMVNSIEEGEVECDTDYFVEFIEGNIAFEFNDSDNFHFNYLIDFHNEFAGAFIGFDPKYLIKLPFELIRKGFTFTDIIQMIE